MKYSNCTLGKVTGMIKETCNEIMEKGIDSLKPKLILGNRKIGLIWHFSTAAIASCGNCGECKKYCYELKAYLQHHSVLLSRCRNFLLTKYRREETFESIVKQLKRKKSGLKVMRWHVGGEIQDIDYFDRMIKVAKECPDWRFYTYTKMYSIVNAWMDANGELPSNFVVMFSEWDGMPMENPYNMPTFRCIMANGSSKPLQSDEWLCPGNCGICVNAHRGCPYGEKCAAHEH